LSTSLFYFSRSIPCPLRSTLFPYTTLFRSFQFDRFISFASKQAKNSIVGLEPTRVTHSCYLSWRRVELAAREKQSQPCTSHQVIDRKSTRLNSSHVSISYAVFCLTNITTLA